MEKGSALEICLWKVGKDAKIDCKGCDGKDTTCHSYEPFTPPHDYRQEVPYTC